MEVYRNRGVCIMRDDKIFHKTVKRLLKRGYWPDKDVMKDIRKTIAFSYPGEKKHPYFILGLVCDYGFYIGVTSEE